MLRFLLGLLLGAALIAFGLAFADARGVIALGYASTTQGLLGATPTGAQALYAQLVVAGALLGGVCVLLLTLRGIFRRLRARGLAKKGQRLKGKVLLPLILYAGALGGIGVVVLVIALSSSGGTRLV
jgi:hypothetical protein